MPMNEATSSKPEKYTGNEIEEIMLEGGTSTLRNIRILLKNGKHIHLTAELNVSQYNIRPVIIASRGSWGKVQDIKKED